MTEEEAKTKWCPFIQVSAGGGCLGVASNRSRGSHTETGGEGKATCIASACMAWRWETGMETDRDDRGYVSGHYKTTSDEQGFCGPAGKP